MKKIVKNLMLVGLGVALITPAIATPLLLANKKSNDNIDHSIPMPLELHANSKGEETLVSNITITNISDYITDFPLSDQDHDVSIEDLKIPQNNPDGGTILLTLKISKKSNRNLFNIKTFEVNGFMYESENVFKQTKLNSTSLAKTILPSELAVIDDKKEIEKYIQNIPDLSSQNAEVSILYKSANDLNGELTLTLLYKKNLKSLTRKLTVDGFKSLDTEYKQQINQEFKKFIFEPSPRAIKVLPSKVDTYDKLRSYVLGFDDVILENEVSWEVSNILPNDENGEIAFDLTLSKGEGSSKVSIKKNYVVDKFKTTLMQDEDDVNSVFESLIPYKPRVLNLAQQTYPSKVNKDNINSYIANLPVSPINDVNLEYDEFVSNDETGELNFTIKVKKNNIEKKISQTSIYGFFGNHIVSFVLKDLKDSIKKLSPNYFIHDTDPFIVNPTNFGKYFTYNINNKYGINVNIKNVEFIPIEAKAHFRLTCDLQTPNGVTKTESIDWSLGTLYLSDVFVDLTKENYTNKVWSAKYKHDDISTYQVASDKIVSLKYDPITGHWYAQYGIQSIIWNSTVTWLEFNKLGKDPEFAKLLKQHNTTYGNVLNEIVANSINHQYGTLPPNINAPYGTNLYLESRTGSQISGPYYDAQTNTMKYEIDKILKNKSNSFWMHLSFDTNGKYNFMYTKTKLLINMTST